MIDRSRWNVQYMQRVLATDPIAYWMMDEKQGAVSYDMVTARSNGARNAAYTGVTLGQPGIGDGRTSALYDGANDFDAIGTANLIAAFNPNEGSLMCWIRVFNAGVWTDGAFRTAAILQVNGNNRIILRRTAANNTFAFLYVAGAVASARDVGGLVTTGWLSALLTWSVAADEVIAYLNGGQQGAILNGLGVWVGALVAGTTCIGAANIAPANVWNGWLAHGAVWDYALPPAEARAMGVL